MLTYIVLLRKEHFKIIFQPFKNSKYIPNLSDIFTYQNTSFDTHIVIFIIPCLSFRKRRFVEALLTIEVCCLKLL